MAMCGYKGLFHRFFGDGKQNDSTYKCTVGIQPGSGIAGAHKAALLGYLFGPNVEERSAKQEGYGIYMIDEIVACSAVNNNLTNVIPKGATILSVNANAQAALTGGGTTVTWSIGPSGTPNKYGTAGYPTAADLLTKNSKSTWTGATQTAAATEQIAVNAAATGGASAGNTALTVGSVRVVVVYMVGIPLIDAP